MDASKVVEWSKKILMPGQSLLLPMMILALGLHAALLAIPIPSTEAAKEAEDQKNPITVSQIPTEQPTGSPTAAAKVDIPDMAAPTVSSDAGTTTTDVASDTPTTDATSAGSGGVDSTSAVTSANTTTAASTGSKPAQKPAATASASSEQGSNEGSTAATSDASTPADTPSEPEPAAPVAVAPSTDSASQAADSPFAQFPHYQPSEADCFGLGFGENCRVIVNGAIAQVADFFKKELTAKAFTTNLVTDEPKRKVFKVSKGEQTLFLNIWQGQDRVSYLLSRVVVKQPPEEIKTEAGK